MEWPLAAPAADRPLDTARPRAARERLAIVRADFFLDESGRLTDEERSLMAAMLRGLISDIGDEIIAALPAFLAAHADAGRDTLYRQLRNTGLVERDGLVALLLRRADEQQLSARMERGGDAFVATLVGDADAPVADAAMGLTVARGRRRDRFGRLGIEFDDLAAEDAVALAYAVAGVLREQIEGEADQLLALAAQALLVRHDEGKRLDAAVAALARALDAAGRSDDAMLGQIAQAGDAALLVALLSRRAGIEGADGWAFFSGGEAMMLARLAGCERGTAAQILAAFDALFGLGAPDRAIERFDALDDDQVTRCRGWLRLDPHYRAARDILEARNG
ncbi:MAG: hypothetical protein H0W65_05825 [Sphingomonas sp.]|uniref:DUF2336 domain-containing protein n=1 Tax=Sphingomonas sp. TaxID=28214 RepID=UPI0017E0C567|nr:DUF2336 domain-containing protein [Sphingomonas sp.]MBA3667222.1 hypothetical protein [Sphingomonas sp.]